MEYLWVPLVLAGGLAALFLLILLDPVTPLMGLFCYLLGLPQRDKNISKAKKSRWGRLADKWEAEDRDLPPRDL